MMFRLIAKGKFLYEVCFDCRFVHFFTVMQSIAHGQEPESKGESTPVLEERIRNAEVNKTTPANGTAITEFKFAGNLKPNFDLGCIKMDEATIKFNPPALIYAAKKCIQRDQYAQAWALISTANGFAYYDLRRLAYRSTQGTRAVLMVNALHGKSRAGQRGESATIEPISLNVSDDRHLEDI